MFFPSRTAASCFSSPMNVLGRSGTFRTPPWFPWVQVDYCTWMKRRWRAMFWVVSFWIEYWLVGLMIVDVYSYCWIDTWTHLHEHRENDLPRHPPIGCASASVRMIFKSKVSSASPHPFDRRRAFLAARWSCAGGLTKPQCNSGLLGEDSSRTARHRSRVGEILTTWESLGWKQSTSDQW